MAEQQVSAEATLIGRLRGAGREFWFVQTVNAITKAGVFDLIAQKNVRMAKPFLFPPYTLLD